MGAGSFLGEGVPVFLVSRSNTTSPHPHFPSLGTSGVEGGLTRSSLNSLQMRKLRQAHVQDNVSCLHHPSPRLWVWLKATCTCQYYRYPDPGFFLCQVHNPRPIACFAAPTSSLAAPFKAYSGALCPLGLGRALLFRAADQPGVPS